MRAIEADVMSENSDVSRLELKHLMNHPSVLKRKVSIKKKSKAHMPKG